jgi:hypothetical protein
MAQKPANQNIHRSMQGKVVDMNKLINVNELTPAVGNMNVNARGDKLGPGGQIIKKREELAASANSIPDQINIRATEKDVSDMDPEGKE